MDKRKERIVRAAMRFAKVAQNPAVRDVSKEVHALMKACAALAQRKKK
jgi:hypothetical protein